MGTFFGQCEILGGWARNRAVHLGNAIMGACLQAPHAAPGYKLMEAEFVGYVMLSPYVFIGWSVIVELTLL